MLFKKLIQNLTIDVFELLAVIISLIFLYTQILPFYKAAVLLGYVNGQMFAYIIYSLLLLVLPIALLLNSPRFNKGKFLQWFFYVFSAVIFIGTVCDLVTYKFFMGYTFSEGDMVFVNIMWNIPNLFGSVFSIGISVLYLLLGKWILLRRRIPYIIFVSIVVISSAVPFLYTYLTTGMLPRETWLHKALLIIPEQLFILVSLSVCVHSRSLWREHIWN